MRKQQGSAAVVLFIILVIILGLLGWWVWSRDRDDKDDKTPNGEEFSMRVENVGFQIPESVLHDPIADIYLVTNINGGLLEANDRGFISRLSPDGTVSDLKWIDGEDEDVTLNTPRGMAIVDDDLYVADIDRVRVFHRETGEPVREIPVAGASFLNDLAADDSGTVYVSDTGLDADLNPTGTDAVHMINGTTVTTLVASTELSLPNGLAVDDGIVYVVPFGSSTILSVNSEGEISEVATLPAAQLDGVIRFDNGTMFVSSWEGEAVYSVNSSGVVSVVAGDLPAPADIGYDQERRRLLTPLFYEDAIDIRSVNY